MNTFSNTKRALRSAITILSVAAAAGTSTLSQVTPGVGQVERFVAGDFDGDGRIDQVIVDRETGSCRIGHQKSAGVFTWTQSRASGIENVSSATAGRLFNGTQDALAVTGPEANQVNVLSLADPQLPSPPVSFFPLAVGPNLVVAADVGGAGNTTHDDLFIGARWNGASAFGLELARNNAGAFTRLPASVAGVTGLLEEGERIVVKTGQPALVGAVLRTVPTNTFVAYRLTTGRADPRLWSFGLPPGSKYAWGQFRNLPYSQLLFYVPGQSNLFLRTIAEPIPDEFSVNMTNPFGLEDAIGQVSTLNGPTPRLLILSADGGRARVYDFDGINAPTLRQRFDAAPGEAFTGVGGMGDGNLSLYSSRDGSGRSTYFQPYRFDGSRFVAQGGGTLPAVNPLMARGNVLLFERDPFVSPAPNLLRSFNAGDWSSGLGSLPGVITVTAESFASDALGLGSPVVQALGASPTTAKFGLVNQHASYLSFFNRETARGDEGSDVRILPPPGSYSKAVSVRIRVANPSDQVFYRTSLADEWTQYIAGSSLPLFKTTTVQYYAKSSTGTGRSRIHVATYTITVDPGTLDTDGDGVPDFVEIAKGLNPEAGADSDGDGHSDLEELLAGTNPNDQSSIPSSASGSPILDSTSFDLAVTPRPLASTNADPSLSQTGTAIRAFGVDASLRAFARTTTNSPVPGVAVPVAYFSGISPEPGESWLVLATEPTFSLATDAGDHSNGREMLGLLPVPALPTPPQVDYAFRGGPLDAEAQGWLAAAASAYSAGRRTIFTTDLTVHDSLVAIIVERKIQELLLQRGTAAASNLSLFGFRPTDAGRYRPSQTVLSSLTGLGTGNEPAFLVREAVGVVRHSALLGSNPSLIDLRALTAAIYRLSATTNVAVLGTLASPVDALREFVRSGTFPANYSTQLGRSQAQFSSAFTGVQMLLESIASRPVVTVDLRVESDSFAGPCTVLGSTGIPTRPWSLGLPGGRSYPKPAAFDLPPGAIVRVTGFNDRTNELCATAGLEVISLTLVQMPMPPAIDLDRNLLADEWEALFRVRTPFGDADGDGYSNLQEMLEGSDPQDSSSRPAGNAVAWPAKGLSIQSIDGGVALRLSWDWPEPYASRMVFRLESAEGLDGPFVGLAQPAIRRGDHFEMVLPNDGRVYRFFRLAIEL